MTEQEEQAQKNLENVLKIMKGIRQDVEDFRTKQVFAQLYWEGDGTVRIHTPYGEHLIRACDAAKTIFPYPEKL